jgi:predicted NodU family carbamoyl transferase
MGLAPYGEPHYLREMRRIIHLRGDGGFRLNLDYFRHHREKVEYEWDDGSPVVGLLYSKALEDLLGPARQKSGALTQYHKDLARSVQAMYEEALFNLKIKRRESFRPFAPSILREKVAEWFELDDDVPFMMKVFPIRKEQRARIPAVTHVDGSGRLQTVYEQTNPRYYRLIRAFEAITGVPMVLNTSFNENEPVVCRPGEALDCFLRTKMDILVVGDFFLARQEVG